MLEGVYDRSMTTKTLAQEIEDCAEEIDPIAGFDALMNICDAMDLQLARTIARIKYADEKSLSKEEFLIAILIESSQSNLQRSMRLMQRAAIAEEMMNREGR